MDRVCCCQCGDPRQGVTFFIWLKRAGFALFFIASLLHLFSQRPLWSDEVYVLNNLQGLSFGRIFGPLNNAQGFPRVYLFLVKALGQGFDWHVLALRALPFLAMFGGFAVWIKLFEKAFEQVREQALAIFAFGCCFAFSYYSGELKHYSLDVLAAGLYGLYFLSQPGLIARPLKRGDVILAGAMSLLMFFSYAAIFIFWVGAVNLVVLTLRERRLFKLLAAYLLSALFAFALIYWFDLRWTSQQSALISYWDSYFICLDSARCFWSSFGEGLRRIPAWSFGRGKLFLCWGSFLIPIFLYSLFRHGLWRLRPQRGIFDLFTLGGLLTAELFVLGVFKIFPFTGERITLYLVPFVIILLVKAVEDARRVRWLYWFMLANLIVYWSVCAGNAIMHYASLYGN